MTTLHTLGRYLLDAGGNPNSAYAAVSPLRRALASGLPANVRLLLSRGAKWTGAHRAASYGQIRLTDCVEHMEYALDAVRDRSAPAGASQASADKLTKQWERRAVACVGALRANITWDNRAVARMFVWGSSRMRTQATASSSTAGPVCAAPAQCSRLPVLPADALRIVLEFAGNNTGPTSHFDTVRSVLITKVLSKELSCPQPNSCAVRQLLRWGAVAFPGLVLPAGVPPRSLALIRELMLRATAPFCPTEQANNRNKLKALSLPAKKHVGDDVQDSDVAGQHGNAAQETDERDAADSADASNCPCSHVYFAASARYGNHLKCAQALVRAKCNPETLHQQPPTVKLQNAFSAAISNTNTHAAGIARFLHHHCRLDTCVNDTFVVV